MTEPIFVVSKYAIGIVGVNMPFEFSRFEVISDLSNFSIAKVADNLLVLTFN